MLFHKVVVLHLRRAVDGPKAANSTRQMGLGTCQFWFFQHTVL